MLPYIRKSDDDDETTKGHLYFSCFFFCVWAEIIKGNRSTHLYVAFTVFTVFFIETTVLKVSILLYENTQAHPIVRTLTN